MKFSIRPSLIMYIILVQLILIDGFLVAIFAKQIWFSPKETSEITAVENKDSLAESRAASTQNDSHSATATTESHSPAEQTENQTASASNESHSNTEQTEGQTTTAPTESHSSAEQTEGQMTASPDASHDTTEQSESHNNSEKSESQPTSPQSENNTQSNYSGIFRKDILKFEEDLKAFIKRDLESMIVPSERDIKLVDFAKESGEFTATAYDLSYESCKKYPSHPAYGITYSGKKAVKGRTAAVDPEVIPIGSNLYIEFPQQYAHLTGWYVAEDIGSKVKGNIIDIFFGESAYNEAKRFGSRRINVRIIHPEEV